MSDSIITDSNQILTLMKSIFSYFENIDNLEILTDEFNLRDIIYSIEPKIENIDLIKDNDFGIRYGNFQAIFNKINKYLSNHVEKNNFTEYVNFENYIDINNIINKDKKTIYLLCEILIFLSSISSNQESFEKLESCSESSISLYLSISNKYSEKYHDDETKNNNNINNNNDELYKEIDEKNNQITTLQKNNTELEMKYKESLLQIKTLKENIENNRILSEELLNEKTKLSKIENEYKLQIIEKDDLIKEYKEKNKSLNNKIDSLEEKILSYESKLENYNEIKIENKK